MEVVISVKIRGQQNFDKCDHLNPVEIKTWQSYYKYFK